MFVTLNDMPEEILERILALVLVQSAEPSSRPPWHAYQTAPATRHATVVSPLLVCRTWLRVATPIHYRHPVLRTPRHVELLVRALRHTPTLAPCVRSLHVHATSPALRDLVPLCYALDTLDVTVDNADALTGAAAPAPTPAAAAGAPAGEAPMERGVIEFCEGFRKTRNVRHLVIRKNAYLTQSNAIYIFEQLAKAVARWPRLETVDVAFRLSPSPAASALVKALAGAPRLHTLKTQLPAVWNPTLLEIAQNPALVRIVLDPKPELAGAHLFLAEAKRHSRLLDLIRAGSPPPSPRAHPHPAVAFAPPTSARARAASAVVNPGRPPMHIPTWAYERDVPPPACPPATTARRPVQGHHGGAGSMVGPSAYTYAPAGPSGPTHPHAQHHHQAPAAFGNHPGRQYAHDGGHYHAASRVPTTPAVQPPFVGGQLPRRSAPGSRRMTAS